MFLIGIDGLAGSGKSTLAGALAEELHAQVVALDDFSSWDGDRWTPANLGRVRREVIDPLRVGEPARYQRYDWDRRCPGDWATIEARGIVIVEGVRALHTDLADVYGLRLWVETPRDLRLARGLARDGSAFAPQWQLWMAHEDRYVAEQNPAARADAVLPGSR
jgi:uridine kinase